MEASDNHHQQQQPQHQQQQQTLGPSEKTPSTGRSTLPRARQRMWWNGERIAIATVCVILGIAFLGTYMKPTENKKIPRAGPWRVAGTKGAIASAVASADWVVPVDTSVSRQPRFHEVITERPFNRTLEHCLISGNWELVLQESGSQYPNYTLASCPVMQKNYPCAGEHRHSVDRFKYTLPDACPFLGIHESKLGQPGGCLAGKHISIVGDSLTHQLLHSIECQLGPYLTKREIRTTYEFKGEARERDVRMEFANGMTLRWVFIGGAANRSELILQSYAPIEDFWKLADKDADLIMSNFAVFHLTDLEYKPRTRLAKMMEYGEILSQAKGRVMIIGASAKHDNGHLKCAESNVPLPVLLKDSPKQIVDLISLKNQQLQELANKFGFDFLDVEPMTKTRIDGHVSERDCSHYCLPGIPDLWTDMMTTLLCEKKLETEKKE
eukprot:m.121496 g.121496  ORF g.121496 m.121496 type:complete len:439 (+) comp23280_c0_seq5:626-1942(+)